MPSFYLENLGRNVARISDRVSITNTSEHPAEVMIDCKGATEWRPFETPIVLAPGASWSAAQAELDCEVVRVIARGYASGRQIVRVEY